MIAKAADIDVAEVKSTPGELTLTWQNSTYSVYSSLWLRDNDPRNRDAATGQRLITLLDLPDTPRLRTAEPRPPGHITLAWEDGETSVFSLTWLRAFDHSLRIGPRPTRLPWMGQPAAVFAWSDYAEWLENTADREDWLYYAGRDGLAFLRNVPSEDAAVLSVAERIGFIRETNYGRIFDVRSVAKPNNLAFTNLGLPVHTDNPYRDPVPGFQLLHCLSASGQGGESIFVDGMAVAERVRAHDPDAFSTLLPNSHPLSLSGRQVDLCAERTMLDSTLKDNSAPSITTTARLRRCHSRVPGSRSSMPPTVSLPSCSTSRREQLSTGCSPAILSSSITPAFSMAARPFPSS